MEDRKRAETLLRRIGKQPQPSYVEEILAAFAEERRLERDALRARGASAGPAEGLPPAESQGAPTAIRAEGTSLAAAPSAQPRETPSAELNTRTARSADGLPVVDFDRDALADGSGDFADGTMETPLGGPTGTQASETPAEGEDRVASLIREAMLPGNGNRAEGYLKEALALLARRPHGR